jgi:hypothetical protein
MTIINRRILAKFGSKTGRVVNFLSNPGAFWWSVGAGWLNLLNPVQKPWFFGEKKSQKKFPEKSF